MAALDTRYGKAATHRTIAQWINLAVPLERKYLLIGAGIDPEDVFVKETRRLTADDLAILAALYNRPAVYSRRDSEQSFNNIS